MTTAHLVAFSVSTHQSQHAETGLCTAVDKSYHLHAGNPLNDHLGQHILQLTGGSKGGSLCPPAPPAFSAPSTAGTCLPLQRASLSSPSHSLQRPSNVQATIMQNVKQSKQEAPPKGGFPLYQPVPWMLGAPRIPALHNISDPEKIMDRYRTKAQPGGMTGIEPSSATAMHAVICMGLHIR